MYRTEISFRPDEIVQYLRKSRTDDPYLSVEEVLSKHETILREWAERNLSGPVPEENIFREIVSGETIKDRPEFRKLLRLIESPDIKAILCVEVQRLSRGDLEDAGRLMKILRFTHTQVITPHKIYDLEDEYDRDFFERELKRGNEFLEYTKKILNRAATVAVSNTSGLAGIAFWLNEHYHLDGEDAVQKTDPLVAQMKAWVDDQYAGGRTTSIGDEELEKLVQEMAPQLYTK